MQPAENGVVLPKGHTASSLFHSVLRATHARFARELAGAGLPEDPKAFKRDYGALLARFEAARVGSSRSAEMARYIAATTQAALELVHEGRRVPLAEHLAAPEATPLAAAERTRFGDAPRLRIELPFEGELHRDRNARALVQQLAEQHDMTKAAADALCWMIDRAAADGGALDLRGRRFVLLGAGAELSPARMLLEAGADVLWVDLAEPRALLRDAGSLSGTLERVPGAANLLEAPSTIVRAIARFAEAGPVDVGMYAYAAGASQEWRLAATMAAIVAHLPAASVASVALLVSPTTAAVLDPECIAEARARYEQRSWWKKLLVPASLLRAPGSYEANGVHVGLSTVSIQGLGYQAAQYVSKLATAEAFARYGVDLHAEQARPVTVSANVAGITRTRSLSHPLFQAAFLGAPRFGVRIFDPECTRALSGLLMLHDVLNPSAPGAAALQPDDARDKRRRLFSQKIHGGIYALPFELEGAIRVAALIGMSQKPSLMLRT